MNKKIGSTSLILAGLLLVPASQSWAKAQAVYNPDPITVPCALSAEKVRAAVRTGVLGRGWIPTDKGAGVVEARLDKRKHVAVVHIKHSPKTVGILYHSSENLDYSGEGAGATIHHNYNNWIKNIEKDITLNLSKACG